ncbi:hypothetical protein ACERZ8_13175 [Tateyamaria armeniaca]|uniref:Uncharacterized protein n=1 Tax=Tateyamaria armeniaca TaxID=2518930 RepID=A0ABW8UY00_9RHOB
MSSTDTSIEKQTKRHRPALVGIGVAVISVIVVIVALANFGFGPGIDEASSGEPADESMPMVSE